MHGKSALFLAILTAATLSACGSADNERVVGTEQAAIVSESETTEETTTETTIETVTEDEIVDYDEPHDGSERPVIISASERFDSYPMYTAYEETPVDGIQWEIEVVTEKLYNSMGVHITDFTAKYPVFSGADEAVCEKINRRLKKYCDEAYAYEKGNAETVGFDNNGVYDSEIIDIYERTDMKDMREISFEIDFAHGNILSVCLTDFTYYAGAAHGYPLPVTMLFDMRTGEQVKLSEMIADKEAFAEKFRTSIIDLMFTNRLDQNDCDMSGYGEFVEAMKGNELPDYGIEYGIDENGNFIIGYCVADDRLTVKNGSICFYIAPYEYGSYADGIRLAEVPIDNLLSYMNDEGKALFDGIVSSELVPVDIISYKGFEYPKVLGYIPTVVLTEGMLTDGDYEFISLLEKADYLHLEGYENIDFARLAEMKNLRMLSLSDCKFDDISPLFGSDINYISDSGYNISKEQADEFAEKNGGIVYPERE